MAQQFRTQSYLNYNGLKTILFHSNDESILNLSYAVSLRCYVMSFDALMIFYLGILRLLKRKPLYLFMEQTYMIKILFCLKSLI